VSPLPLPPDSRTAKRLRMPWQPPWVCSSFGPRDFLIQGDNQNVAQLAQLKGEMDAIEHASIQKNCGIQFRPAPAASSYVDQK